MAISKESVGVGSIELESEGDLGSRYIIIANVFLLEFISMMAATAA